ncbi:VWA domain-containing protein [soil metagenome]
MRLACGVVLFAALVACGKADNKETPGTPGTQPPVTATPETGPHVTLRFAYSSEKKAWLEQVLPQFAATHPKLANGRAIVVEATSYGSGEASAAILDGSFKANVYSPASSAYLALLNDKWRASHGGKQIAATSEPLVLSPIVIAMWKPMAEALGWPTKDIGWSDIIKVSKDPRGWASLDHPEWGLFKLGHTHPEFSNSGLLAVLAEAFAGAGKTRGLTVEDVKAPKTSAYVHQIEDAIVHYGKSTGLFTEQMLDHGPGYMSAAITYENLVSESYAKPGHAPFPLVAIYPVEGTFWSDHPYAVLDTETTGADEKAAAAQLLAFLKARPQQESARAFGFRPADPKLEIAAPLDLAHGVDPKQPQTLLDVPPVEVLTALLAVWREQKKAADVMIVFDRSGSMAGDPLAQAKEGARAFVTGLDDRDALSILFFSSDLDTPVEPVPLKQARAKLLQQIDGVFANGGTALYDAVDAAYKVMLARAKKMPGQIHAIVVMTDGKDEDSKMQLAALNAKFNPENAPVKIFTIAYGDSADPTVLQSIAKAAQGTSVKGTAATIVEVYRDLSAFF